MLVGNSDATGELDGALDPTLEGLAEADGAKDCDGTADGISEALGLALPDGAMVGIEEASLLGMLVGVMLTLGASDGAADSFRVGASLPVG